MINGAPLNSLSVSSVSKPLVNSREKSTGSLTEIKSSESSTIIFHFSLVINVVAFPFLKAPAFTENIVGNSPCM